MNRYIESLKSFLAEQTPCFGYDDANSILEMLYYYYTVANPVDNAVLRCQFKELNDILCHLSLAENEAIFTLAGVSGWHSCRHTLVLRTQRIARLNFSCYGFETWHRFPKYI